MEHSEKIEIVPKETNLKKYTDKLTKKLKIVLKLARIDAYDSIGRIKNKDGNFVENSNLIQLLSNAMMFSRVLVGQEEFIHLLHKAEVEPELISNDNIRVKLQQLYSKIEKEVQPKIREEINKGTLRKRKREDDILENDRHKRMRSEFSFPDPDMPVLKRYDEDDNKGIASINVNDKRKRNWENLDDD